MSDDVTDCEHGFMTTADRKLACPRCDTLLIRALEARVTELERELETVETAADASGSGWDECVGFLRQARARVADLTEEVVYWQRAANEIERSFINRLGGFGWSDECDAVGFPCGCGATHIPEWEKP